MTIPRDLRLAATTVIAILIISSNARAQEPERCVKPAPTNSEHKVTGILTDRLTKSQLKAWGSIMQIILAKDKEGKPLHPKLFGLYQQADASGHAIFVEMAKPSFAYDVPRYVQD